MFNLYAIDHTVPNHGHRFIGSYHTRERAEKIAANHPLCIELGYFIEVE